MVGFVAIAIIGLGIMFQAAGIPLDGWWWAAAIGSVFAWWAKRKKAALQQQPNLETIVSSASPGVIPPLDFMAGDIFDGSFKEASANGPSKVGFNGEIEQLCAGFSFGDYYVAELIPSTKRANAMTNYAPPGGGEIIALVDATVFGSAKDGLAIGPHGISWHNNSATPTPITSLTWAQFASALLVGNGSTLSIGEGKLWLGGSQMKPEQLIEVLYALKRSLNNSRSSQTAEVNDSASKTPPLEEMTSVAKAPIPIMLNNANLDDLITLPGIGVAEAHLIIKRRVERPFTSATELVQFLDLKPHLGVRMESRASFSVPADPQTSAAPTSSAPPMRGRTID